MNGNIQTPSPFNRWQGEQRRIGITGSIASGKSSIGSYLEKVKGLPTIDADVYARETLSDGSHVSELVIKRYGRKIVNYEDNGDSSINRNALSKIIFTNKEERNWLENLVHPLIKTKINQSIEIYKHEPIIILIIPLLFETNLSFLCSEVWLVSCKPEQQLKRLIERDKLTAREAKKRIKSQWPLKSKVKFADAIIDNSSNQSAWTDQVDKLLSSRSTF